MSIAFDSFHTQGLPVDVPVTLYTPSKHQNFQFEPLNDLAIEDLTEEHEPGSTVHVSVSVSLQESLASIANWASQIAPGSPPAPSPRSASFYTPSLEDEPKALQNTTFLNLHDTPSSSRTYKNQGQRTPNTPVPKPVSPRDLLAQGYTSIFVHLPSLSQYCDPETPSPVSNFALGPLPRSRPCRPRTKSLVAKENKSVEQEKKSGKLNRIRSLSFKARKPIASSPPPPIPQMPSFTKPEMNHNTRIPSSTKKPKPKSTPHSRYGALLGPGNGAGALPLAQEVELIRMLDGGSKDHNVRRVAERHARDTGAVNHHVSSKTHRIGESNRAQRGSDRDRAKDHRAVEKRERERVERVGGGVPGVYRDERGMLWWDEDEALELTGLLPEEHDLLNDSIKSLGPPSIQNTGKAEKRRGLLPRLMMNTNKNTQSAGPGTDWVPLTSPVVGSDTVDGFVDSLHGTDYDPARRGSATSGEHSSDVDPDLDPSFAIQLRDATLSNSPFVPGYSMNVERHMRRREPRGIDAFGRPGISPLDIEPESGSSTPRARERKERKRPAPLTLAHPLPIPQGPASVALSTSTVKKMKTPKPEPLQVSTLVLNGFTGPTREECEGREEYFSDQFIPPLSVTSPNWLAPKKDQQPQDTVGLKKSRRGSVTLFRRRASVQGVSSGLLSHTVVNENENRSIPLMRTSTATSEVPGNSSTGRSKLKGLFKRGT